MHQNPATGSHPDGETSGTPGAAHNAPGGKLVWHTPTLEEVPFTRTEAAGVGAVYDLTVYTGSV